MIDLNTARQTRIGLSVPIRATVADENVCCFGLEINCYCAARGHF